MKTHDFFPEEWLYVGQTLNESLGKSVFPLPGKDCY